MKIGRKRWTQMSETWNKIVALKDAGKAEAKGVANLLSDDDITTIIATIDFFGGDYRQDIWDLRTARYRVFDWLGMRVQGRGDNDSATKVLAHSFIKVGGVPSKFIEDLRITDYDIDHSWEKIEL